MLNIPIREYSTPSPYCAQVGDTVRKVQEMLQDAHINHVPVLREDAVVGMISDRDVRTVMSISSAQDTPVEEIMSQCEDFFCRGKELSDGNVWTTSNQQRDRRGAG